MPYIKDKNLVNIYEEVDKANQTIGKLTDLLKEEEENTSILKKHRAILGAFGLLLLLLFIWFITNKHWWVHVLIIPISVYLFQLISVINDNIAYVDEVEFIYTVPIAVIILVVLYFIRSKMAIYIQAMDLKKEMDENMKIQKKID